MDARSRLRRSRDDDEGPSEAFPFSQRHIHSRSGSRRLSKDLKETKSADLLRGQSERAKQALEDSKAYLSDGRRRSESHLRGKSESFVAKLTKLPPVKEDGLFADKPPPTSLRHNNKSKDTRSRPPSSVEEKGGETLLAKLREIEAERDSLAAQNRALADEVATLKQQAADATVSIRKAVQQQQETNKKISQYSEECESVRRLVDDLERPVALTAKLDEMSYRLRKAERRNRYLSEPNRWKGDAQYQKRKKSWVEGWFSMGRSLYEADEFKQSALVERKGAEGLAAKPAEQVVAMMERLNSSVAETSVGLAKLVVTRGSSRGSPERANKVLGDRAVDVVLHALPAGGTTTLNSSLVQSMLQLFLVFWCTSIVEAWYPPQRTFAEFLVGVCSQLKVDERSGACGSKMRISQVHTRDSRDLFDGWVKDILSDLRDVLSAFGWAIEQNSGREWRRRTDTFRDKLLPLLKEAYDLRTAIAEVTSGDVELAIVPYDTPFDPKSMDEDRGSPKARDGDTDAAAAISKRTRVVVRTTGIGIQRDVVKRYIGGVVIKRDVQVVLKPKVLLEHTLKRWSSNSGS